MKKLLPFAVAAALCAPAFGQSATSQPVGYETIELRPSSFTLLGLRLADSPVATGEFDSTSDDQLTDNEANFSAFVDAETYVVEFANGAIITALGSDFTTDSLDNLSGDLSSLVTSYTVRTARTLTDVFGADNSLGLNSTTSVDTADVVHIPNAAGVLERFYYAPEQNLGFATLPAGWKDSGGNDADPVIDLTDSIFVQRRGGDESIDLVVTGSVVLEQKALNLVGDGSFNFVGGVFPSGATLDNSGLQAVVTEAVSIDDADVVYISDATGTLQRYYYAPEQNLGFAVIAEGWKDSGGNPAGDTELSSGILIERRASGAQAGVITPPASYSNL